MNQYEDEELTVSREHMSNVFKKALAKSFVANRLDDHMICTALVETLAAELPGLTSKYGKRVRVMKRIEVQLNSRSTVELQVGETLRVMAHRFRMTEAGPKLCLQALYGSKGVFIEKSDYNCIVEDTYQLIELADKIRSRAVCSELPACLHNERYMEVPVLDQYDEEENVPDARTFYGQDVRDFRITAITQDSTQEQAGDFNFYLSRVNEPRFCIKVVSKLDPWF